MKMSDCASTDPLVTPYVDDELTVADRQRVDEHMRVCPPCHARVAAERAVHELIRARKAAFDAERASPALRATCARLKAQMANDPGARAATWRTRLVPLALAATLVMVVGGAFLYQATDRSARLMAAELAADHVKCFTMNALLHTQEEPASVQQSMLSEFGWRIRVPAQREHGLELVGSRPCLYGKGRVAHLMYRHDGRPVSIFMLPNSVRPEEVVQVMGHEAVIWSVGARTFVLITREPRAEAERMAALVQSTLN
jgi:anti-sigma factor RsiW